MQNSRQEVTVGSIMKYVALFVFGILAISAFFGSFFTVDSGKKAIVLQFGKVSKVANDGLNFKVPFITSVEEVTIRTLTAEAAGRASSSNMQMVDTKVSLNYHYNPDKLAQIYTRTGFDVESIIHPRIQEVVKSVTAKYTAEQLISRREEVKSEIKRDLANLILSYDLIAEDIQITNFDFSKQFIDAIEEKQTAEQKALTAKNNLERIKIEAEQSIATAKGTAEAIRIQTEAIRSGGGAEYLKLKAIEKWDGKLPTYNGGSGPLPILNLN